MTKYMTKDEKDKIKKQSIKKNFSYNTSVNDILKQMDEERKKGHFYFYTDINGIRIYSVDINYREDLKRIMNYTDEEVDKIIALEQNQDTKNIDHAKKIAKERLTTRVQRGKDNIIPEKRDEWQRFVILYSNKEIPYNFEIESILKYIIMLNDNTLKIDNIAKDFYEEFSQLDYETEDFILSSIVSFSKRGVELFKQVQMLSNNKFVCKEEFVKCVEETNNLIGKGLTFDEATILEDVKIAKFIENGYENGLVIIFSNGNIEGIDNQGNWLFMSKIDSAINNKITVVYKLNSEETMRYIISEDKKQGILSNQNGSFKSNTNTSFTLEYLEEKDVYNINAHLQEINEEFNIIDIPREKILAIYEEICELKSKVNPDTEVLKIDEVLEQELLNLKKSYQ